MRQLIIARKDLNMSAGKLAAQVSHASMAFLTAPLRNAKGDKNRIKRIENGDYVTLLEKLKNMPLDEIKDLYNKREIEK